MAPCWSFSRCAVNSQWTNLLFGLGRLVLPMLFSVMCMAQSAVENDKISASQGISAPLLFRVMDDGLPPVMASACLEGKDYTPRNGLPDFFNRIALANQKVVVAFIGGSITQSDHGYRMQTAKYLETAYPNIRFKWVNAGISGTGTDLGAFRLREHVLSQQPDLVFIEFAVNGAYQPGMEGMVRQVIRHNPKIDICLLYTALAADLALYQEGKVPSRIAGLERIAEHYGLPSIHLGHRPAHLVSAGSLVWRGENSHGKDRVAVFSSDGIHPLPQGGNLYAGIVAGSLERMKTVESPAKHRLPEPLVCGKWELADMYFPSHIGTHDRGWHPLRTNGSQLDRFNGWFDTLLVAENAGARYTFHFEGDMFGLFDIGGPEVGQLNIWVDDSLVSLIPFETDSRIHAADLIGSAHIPLNRFNRFCNNRYRGQYEVIAVPFGYHKVMLEISSDRADKRAILGPNQWEDITGNPEKYDRTTVYLGRILLRGRPIAKPRNK